MLKFKRNRFRNIFYQKGHCRVGHLMVTVGTDVPLPIIEIRQRVIAPCQDLMLPSARPNINIISGLGVPMFPTLASGLRTGASRVNITIDCDTSNCSGDMFWD